jgi:hypothetical protein
MAGPTVRKLRKLVRLRGGKKTVDELVSELAGNAPAAEDKPAPVVSKPVAEVKEVVQPPAAQPAARPAVQRATQKVTKTKK